MGRGRAQDESAQFKVPVPEMRPKGDGNASTCWRSKLGAHSAGRFDALAIHPVIIF